MPKRPYTRHGHAARRSGTYLSWQNMWARCTNPKCPTFSYYGGRGISICERWKAFPTFLADMGERPAKSTLERLDNAKGYSPENCAWKSHTAQSRNKRDNRIVTIHGITGCVMALCERFGTDPNRVYSRLWRGWSPESAFLVPVNHSMVRSS